ncbi:PadR family transcriptional regulator [Candidatus Woesearchaeota archaeon]|nr:PadR family transcriptional regulator [Candidatus Woesearchaeota archaeon]
MVSKFLDLKGFLSFLILHELKRKSLCGEDLAKKIGKRKGTGPLTPGTIYPALKELRKHGLVSFEQFGRKKMYSLTLRGTAELKTLYADFSKYFAGLRSRIRHSQQRQLKRRSARNH